VLDAALSMASVVFDGPAVYWIDDAEMRRNVGLVGVVESKPAADVLTWSWVGIPFTFPSLFALRFT